MMAPPFSATSRIKYAIPHADRKIVSSGLYSSHSPGFSGRPMSGRVVVCSTPISFMPRARDGSGARSSSRSRIDTMPRMSAISEALPETERLAERDDAADLQNGLWQGSGCRHDQRGGRGQPERPDAAEAEISGRAECTIVGAADPMRHLSCEQRAENQAEAPRDQRREHGEEGNERGRALCRSSGISERRQMIR